MKFKFGKSLAISLVDALNEAAYRKERVVSKSMAISLVPLTVVSSRFRIIESWHAALEESASRRAVDVTEIPLRAQNVVVYLEEK